MTDPQKNTVDALIALAEFRRVRREGRIGREWQISILVWALLAGMVLNVQLMPSVWVRLAAVLMILILHGAWIWWHWKSAERERVVMDALYGKAIDIVAADVNDAQLTASVHEIENASAPSPLRHVPNWLIFITDLLFVTAIVLLPFTEKEGEITRTEIIKMSD